MSSNRDGSVPDLCVLPVAGNYAFLVVADADTTGFITLTTAGSETVNITGFDNLRRE